MPDDTSLNDAGAGIIDDIRVSLVASVGSASPTVGELIRFAPGTVISLNRRISDEVQLLVGERLFATGILEEDPDASEGGLRVRITDLTQEKAKGK